MVAAMAGTTRKTDPELWENIKKEVTNADKGRKPGQWSARKEQIATSRYKKEGGDYLGKKDSNNHLQEWTDEAWDTKSGRESGETGQRYLPKKARESLADEEYAASTARKRADTKRGKQFSQRPASGAEKTAAVRKSTSSSGATKAELPEVARKHKIIRRFRMSRPNSPARSRSDNSASA